MPQTNLIHETAVLTNCTLGNNISIGPFCFLSDTEIGDNAVIEGNVRIEKSTLKNNIEVLWGALIRESILEEGCIIGCEVKKSHLGKGNKAKHPGTSITSTQTGEKVNFWGGCRCANYDGVGKWSFIIGDRVFIGCNAVLSVKANQVTQIRTGTKIGANVHISGDILENSLVYLDRETGKTTVREWYYQN
jgi:bifunctional UDP-N-acetylglucosamine pyrophosphorylase / glucosamine-1-phosphate N-acetyltransferase